MISLHAAVASLALCAPGEPMLLDFYADWCNPCRQMAPVVEQLASQGFPVRKVDVDQQPELAARFRVRSIPCFVMLVDGREVGRLVGQASPAELVQLFRSAEATPEPAAPAVQAGGATLARTPPASPPGVPGDGGRACAEPGCAKGPVAPRLADPDQRLVAATVRLRVEDADGRSCGTGTIIDARQGEALILTCGHLFRDSQGRGTIEVDLFGLQPARALPGRLISYNLERDVALLSIRTPGPVAVARVAPREYRLVPGQEAISVGCNHGQEPTAVHSRITSIDRYLGPPNLQVAGQSVEGRSGGGIFSAEGLLVGVCNAAEPQDNESFCAALAAVHQQLDEAGLAFVYDESPTAPETLLATDGSQWAPEAGQWAAVAPSASPSEPSPPSGAVAAGSGAVPLGQPGGGVQWGDVAEAQGLSAQPLSGATAEQAMLQQIRRHLAEGAEVVCVVRAAGGDSAPPQVIALKDASPGLAEQLAAALRQPRQLTSLAIPDREQSPAAGHAEGSRLARVQPPRGRPVLPVWLPPYHPGAARQQ